TCDTPGTSWQPALVQLANWQPYLAGPGSLHIADLQFHVTGAFGNNVVQSLMNPVADGWGDNNFVFTLNATFGSATINVIPEPTTAILVGIGFLALVAAGRRTSRG
ncbi:MAG: PEP-CTERM sorting domain-containing protein, partial [Planctomycetota bacterium]